MSVLDDVTKEGHLATPEEVKEVVTYVAGGTAVKNASEGAYFKMLLYRTIADGGDEKALNANHKWMYEIVLKELTTKDMTAKERNSATNFARTAKATLRACIKEGIVLVPGLTKGLASNLVKAERDRKRPAPTTVAKSDFNIASQLVVQLAHKWPRLNKHEQGALREYLINSGVVQS